MGFEYFYGFMGGETDQWTPFLFRNTTQIFPWRDQPGYNMITGMADDAIQYLKQLNTAAPDKPFLLYYVPGGSHAPHQPTPEWIDKFKGKFDMGWNELREQIFANQKRLGVIPANTTLTPWPDGQPEYGGAKLAKWDTLSADEKKLFARQAEVFAAYVAYTDHEIGRVIQEVEDEGKLDNTLDDLHQRRQRHERRGHDPRHALRHCRAPRHRGAGCGSVEISTTSGAPRRPLPTWQWRGRGRSTHRSNG